MQSSLKPFVLAVCAAAGFGMVAAPVFAQQGVTKDELKCESTAGKTLAKFVGAKSKCVGKCLSAARKTSGPYTGCFSPFTDPATNTCVNDPVKGAEAKARASIIKGCAKDCPECYADNTPNTCTTGEPLVGATETNIDIFTPGVYCTEFNGGTPTKAEAKCEDTVSKSLVKFVGAKAKCYDKCNQAVFKGTIPAGSCTPGAVTDPTGKTQACISDPVKGAEAKAAAAIDKACATAGANPACYVPFNDTGAEWVALTEAAVDGQTPSVACGSPSGAFLN